MVVVGVYVRNTRSIGADYGDCRVDGSVVARLMSEYYINGGANTINKNVSHMEVRGGVVYVRGKVGRLLHYGGVIYDQRPSNRVECISDRMSEEERSKYRQQIVELENRLSMSEAECLKLRDKLGKEEAETQPDDDVLIAKIEHLQLELDKERAAHRQDLEDMRWRIDTLLDEVNNRHRQIYEDETKGHYIGVTDESLDILFALINEYPIACDRDLAEEYGIPMATLKYIAKALRLAKSPEQRREARERLKQHHLDLIERRGGNQGNFPMSKPVEKVARYGRVIKAYKTINEATEDTGHAADTIRNYCDAYKTKKRKFTKEGYTFRYKKQ